MLRKLEIRDLVSLCASRCVDFVGIGDSNQVYGGHGWDHGFQYALSQRYSMYATGILSQNENGGLGSGCGYKYNRGGTIGATTGAPAELADLWTLPFPHYYAYLTDAQSFSAASPNGLFLDADCPLDVNGNLRFHWGYGTFDAGTGAFRGFIRRENSPFTAINNGTSRNPVTGSFTFQTFFHGIAVDTRNYPLGAKWAQVGGSDITGPFFGMYQRAENLGRNAGFSYHTLLYRGGETLRTFVSDLHSSTNTALTLYFSEVRRLQLSREQSPIVVCCVNGGLNDYNATTTSLGPQPNPTRSRWGYFDNLLAIMGRVREIWRLNGWDESELYWMLFPSHRVSDNPASREQSHLDQYRLAVADIASICPRVVVGDLASLATEREMRANSWYDPAGVSHLTQSGYESLAVRLLGVQ